MGRGVERPRTGPPRHWFGLLLLLTSTASAHAGAPFEGSVQLRRIHVSRCEAVTPANVSTISSYVSAPGRSRHSHGDPATVASSASGVLIEGVIKRQRDLSFPFIDTRERREPTHDTGWADSSDATSLAFFLVDEGFDRCESVRNTVINVTLVDRSECDTIPPAGVCAFDRAVRLVDPNLWSQYGDDVSPAVEH